MADRPDPMTPPDCDLRGMPYMPLDIVRLFDSDFYALSNGDQFKAGLSLWGKAFLQIPAGSLPENDKLLAHLSGAGSHWLKVKEMALHGWVLCNDGRYYHKTVAEKAIEAWQSRLDRRARTEAARAARRAGNNGSEPPPTKAATEHPVNNTTTPATMPVTDNVAISVTDNVTCLATASKGTERNRREGNGTEERKKERPFASLTPSACAEVAREFEAFWEAYPRKVGKGQARRAFVKALPKTTLEAILGSIQRTRWSADPQFQPHPATWLSGERWLDEADTFDPVLRAVGLSPSDFDKPEPAQRRLIQ